MPIGFLLADRSLNHAIMAFGEVTFGVLAGTTAVADWARWPGTFPCP